MTSAFNFLITALASCFFITYPIVSAARKRRWRYTGAGFVGTAAGLLSVGILPMEPLRCASVLLGAIFISIAVSDRAEELMGRKDDQRIVIDEWAGYLASVAFLPHTPKLLLAGFVLFRIVDVWKPLGISRIGNLPGGWGVVMDDLAGGLLVNALLRILPLS